MTNHIPEGFNAVTPYFLVDDVEQFLRFLRDGLGAEERQVHYEDGRLVHGEFHLYDSTIEVGQPKGQFEPTRSATHLFVEDPDKAWQQALDHGAESLFAVADQEYGERSGGVIDPCGNQWYFACVTDPAKRQPKT